MDDNYSIKDTLAQAASEYKMSLTQQLQRQAEEIDNLKAIIQDLQISPERKHKKPQPQQQSAPETLTSNSYETLSQVLDDFLSNPRPSSSHTQVKEKAVETISEWGTVSRKNKPKITNQNITAKPQPQTTNNNTKDKKKMPPIIITDKVTDFPKFHKNIKESTTKTPHIYYNQNYTNTKIYTDSKEDFIALRTKLREKDVHHYTYNPEKPLFKKIVLKCPPFDSAENLLLLLQFHNEKIHSIRYLESKKNFISNTYVIEYPHDMPIGEITKIDRLEGTRVKWAKYNNPREFAQCHNCQGFAHGSTFCGNAPRCVKCAGDHHHKNCAKTPEEPPKCANCGGPHPASYTSCPTYTEFCTQQKLRRGQTTPATPAPAAAHPSTFKPAPWHIPQQQPQQQQQQPNTGIEPSFLEFFKIYQLYQQFKGQFKSCATLTDQLNLMNSITK
jgi:hypothetical protein